MGLGVAPFAPLEPFVVPLVTGMVKEFACGGCCGGEEGEPWTGGSLSMSMELRLDMADMAESRFLCSGGRLSGWMSGSIFFLREEDEPGSVACLTKPRLLRGFGSRAGEAGAGDAGAGVFVWCEAALLGAFFVGDDDLTGEEGSDCEKSSSASSASPECFLDDFLLKKFFIGAESASRFFFGPLECTENLTRKFGAHTRVCTSAFAGLG